MTDLIKINRVEPLPDHWLRITFSDGAVKDVDLSEVLAGGSVFARSINGATCSSRSA